MQCVSSLEIAQPSSSTCSQLVEVGGHLIDLGGVVLLNLLDSLGVSGEHKVDSSSLSTETTGTTDSVDVVLLLDGELVVDNETDLLDIDTSGKQVSGDEDTDGTGSELLHDDVSLELVHLTVHDGDGEVLLGHALLKLLDSSLGVTVDEGLVDVQVGVQVEEDFHLPFLLLDGNVVLVDTFEGELLVLHEDLGGVTHEVLGELQDLRGQSGREESDLDVAGQVLENVLDLGLETTGEHLISLIEDEQLQVVGLHEATLHHVVNTARGSDDDVDATLLEDADVVTDNGTTDASVNLDAHVLTDGVNDEGNLHGQLTGGGNDEGLAVVRGGVSGVSVDALEGGNTEGTGFTSS